MISINNLKSVCLYLFSMQKLKIMNKIIRKEYKKLIKINSLDKLEVYSLLKKLDDKLTLNDYLKLIKL